MTSITTYKEFKSGDSIEEWDTENLAYTNSKYDFLPLSKAYRHYTKWCFSNKYVAKNKTTFYEYFESAGYEVKQRRVWPGMRRQKGIEFMEIEGYENSTSAIQPKQIDKWIEDHFEASSDLMDIVTKKEAYRNFKEYCEKLGAGPIGQSMLTRYIKEEWNIPEKQARVDDKTERCWAGVRFSPQSLSQGGGGAEGPREQEVED
jgi:hypothetical protein